MRKKTCFFAYFIMHFVVFDRMILMSMVLYFYHHWEGHYTVSAQIISCSVVRHDACALWKTSANGYSVYALIIMTWKYDFNSHITSAKAIFSKSILATASKLLAQEVY